MSTLLVVGLALEVGLNFADVSNRWVATGQRLGAPMITAALVALLELLLAWRDERQTSRLHWSTHDDSAALPAGPLLTRNDTA